MRRLLSRVGLICALLLAPAAIDAGTPEVVDSGYLEGAGGARLFYRVVGASGPTVVAVHGGPGAGMNAFYPDLLPLARDQRVIFYDQRGGGRSALPEDESLLDASWFVADLEAVRQHFGLEHMNLVAHSFGAVLVARYALEHPDRVARIALLGATGPQRAAAAVARAESPPSDPEEQRRLGEALTTLLEGTAEDPLAACGTYEEISGAQARRAGEPEGWQGSTCDAPADAVAYYYAHTAQVTPRSFGDWDFTSRLGAVEAPVLVVSGDRPSAAPEQQRAWAAAYPHGRLLIVPGAGKAAAGTHPGPVFTALHTFFAGSWPAAATDPHGDPSPAPPRLPPPTGPTEAAHP